MCIIFWTNQLKRHSLVLAANRDEFLARPTSAVAWHSFSPTDLSPTPSASHNTLSGLDLEGGGTWLGLSLPPASSSRTGLRFGTLTNYTETIVPSTRPSRGNLVKDFLETDDSLERYLERVAGEMHEFAGFNLLLGEMRGDEMRMGYASNREGDSEQLRPRVLDNVGVKGLSNATLESERDREWPKVQTGCAAFATAVQADDDDERMIEGLWDVLSTANPLPITERLHLRHTVLVRPLRLNPKLPLPEHEPPLPSASTTVPETSSPPPPPDPKLLPAYSELDREGVDGGRWYGTRVQTIIVVQRPVGAAAPAVVMYERDAYILGDDGLPRWADRAPRRFPFAGAIDG